LELISFYLFSISIDLQFGGSIGFGSLFLITSRAIAAIKKYSFFGEMPFANFGLEGCF
jgi:hypothetical protein